MDDGTNAAATSADSPSAKSKEALFKPDDVVASRYRIVAFIAEGGMGEVYEAEDLELRDRIALKTVRRELANRPKTVERFKREVHLSRKVTHPNVCRIFDIGQHEGVLFLTMELLRGVTLSRHLKHVGRMSTSEALPVITQIAAAIDAAHLAGIIHRDLKPGNVMLLDDGRVSVTDFGVAATGAGDDPYAEAVSGTGDVVGSPAYMAPEQVEGADATAAADIYSFGIILYEMIAGVRPFESETSLASVVKRLKEDAVPPSRLVPDLDPRWELAIARCMARAPKQRFRSARDAIAALEGIAEPPATIASRRKRRVRMGEGAAVAAVIALGAFAVVRHRTPSTPAVAETHGRRALAVLGFKNLSARPDTAWISTALSEMLGTDLGETLRAIPGEDVARARIELALGETDSFNASTLARVKANLGADVVIVGSYLALGGDKNEKVRVDLRLQDTATGETVMTDSETGTVGELPDLVAHAGTQLREKLGGHASDEKALRASLPASPEAARLYAEALVAQRRFESGAARDLLLEAEAIDPRHPLIHAALAEAWSELGYDGKARDEAKRAFDESGDLPPAEKLLVEARYFLSAKSWDRSIETIHKLAALRPDDPDLMLRLAHAQIDASRGKDALETLATLRANVKSVSTDPRLDLAEARADLTISAYPEATAAAKRAIDHAGRAGSGLIAARAQMFEAYALSVLEQGTEAMTLVGQARPILVAAGDRLGEARLDQVAAYIAIDRGDIAAAEALTNESLAINRTLDNARGEGQALNILGVVADTKGDLEAARTTYLEVVRIGREIDSKDTIVTGLNNTANADLQDGRLDEARTFVEEGIPIARSTDQQNLLVSLLGTLAEIAAARGDVADAGKHITEALAISDRIASIQDSVYDLRIRGTNALVAGDLEAARGDLEKAHTIAVDNKLGPDIAFVDVQRSRLALEEGKLDAAETLARGAVDALHAQLAKDDPFAPSTLAHVLIAEHKLTEARPIVARAVVAAKGGMMASLVAAIEQARLGGATGAHAQALESLADTAAKAERAGYLPIAFAARLAAGELVTDRVAMAALAKDAEAKGCLAIARRALSLAK